MAASASRGDSAPFQAFSCLKEHGEGEGKERRRERKGQTKEKDTKIKGNRNSPSMASDFTDMPDSILLQVRREL